MAKAAQASQVRLLTDIPNIGKSIAQDLIGLGIRTPMGQRHDLCVLDTFLAAKDFMNGGPAQPWWHFTPLRNANKLIPE